MIEELRVDREWFFFSENYSNRLKCLCCKWVIMLGKCVSGQGSNDDISTIYENLAQVRAIFSFVIIYTAANQPLTLAVWVLNSMFSCQLTFCGLSKITMKIISSFVIRNEWIFHVLFAFERKFADKTKARINIVLSFIHNLCAFRLDLWILKHSFISEMSRCHSKFMFENSAGLS